MNAALALHLAMILCGVAAIFWGLPAAHRLPSPWDALAALMVMAGVIVSVMGILLAAVPGFFSA